MRSKRRSAGSIVYELTIDGVPASQGNHRQNGRGMIYDAGGDRLDVWRQLIALQARSARRGAMPLDEPVAVFVTFRLEMPKRPRYGAAPITHPDLDKLQRAVGDALVMGGAIADDGRIVRWVAEKIYAERPGAEIAIARLAS
jgi:Holliday junction resolvase RusA-like endonuclease